MKTLIRHAMVVLPDAIERVNILVDGASVRRCPFAGARHLDIPLMTTLKVPGTWHTPAKEYPISASCNMPARHAMAFRGSNSNVRALVLQQVRCDRKMAERNICDRNKVDRTIDSMRAFCWVTYFSVTYFSVA